MLGNLEAKLAAIVSEGIASRTHLAVGIAPLPTPSVGRGNVELALSGFAPKTGFAPNSTEILSPQASPKSRRILPLLFRGALDFQVRPAADNAAARDDARTLLLEDMSTVAHLLAEPGAQSGAAFETQGPDPGFRVLRFALAGASSPGGLDAAGNYAGRLMVQGDVHVWPVRAPSDEGVISTIDSLIVPLPITLHVANARLRPSGATTISVALGTMKRVVDDTGVRAPLELAVAVLADVPIAARGTVPAGRPGAETGVRIVATADTDDTVIPYQAPAGNPGPAGRLEYLAVHLATPEGLKGPFLGSAPIQLVPAP